jgi:hypothetical protein
MNMSSKTKKNIIAVFLGLIIFWLISGIAGIGDTAPNETSAGKQALIVGTMLSLTFIFYRLLRINTEFIIRPKLSVAIIWSGFFIFLLTDSLVGTGNDTPNDPMSAGMHAVIIGAIVCVVYIVFGIIVANSRKP